MAPLTPAALPPPGVGSVFARASIKRLARSAGPQEFQQPGLKHLGFGIKIFHFKRLYGVAGQGLLRGQADKLGAGYRDVPGFYLFLYLVKALYGGGAVIGEHGGYLHLVLDSKEDLLGAQAGEPAPGGADLFGQTPGELHVGGIQVYVEIYYLPARAYGDGAGGRMDLVGAEIRHAVRVPAYIFLQALELPLSDLRQVAAVRPPGGESVKIEGDIQFPADDSAQRAGQFNAFLDRGVHDGNKRRHVQRAHAGVFAFVVVQVYKFGGLLRGLEHAFHRGLKRSDEGKDGPVMIGVFFHVQHQHPGHGGRGTDDSVYLGGIPALAEIWHAFHEFPHRSLQVENLLFCA